MGLFFKNKFLLLVTFFVLASVIYFVIKQLKLQDIESYKQESYRENIISSKIYLATLIKEKQNATTTIGMGLSKNDDIINAFKSNHPTKTTLKEFSRRISENTDFKNVWFQLVSKEGVSIERSWTDMKSDKIVEYRIDLKQAIEKRNVLNSISVGKFDLTFKTIIPIFDHDNKTYLGVVEVITHFNSIAQKLEEKNIASLILADKKYKNQLKYPFTKKFIGDYYVANGDAKGYLLEYFQSLNLDQYIEKVKKSDFLIDESLHSMVSYYSLNDVEKNINIGHILLIQDMTTLDADNISYINYIYNIYLLFAIIALVLVLYLSATIEIKNIIGKAYSYDIFLYIFIVYFTLSFGIYKLLNIKYESDAQSYQQTLTTQTLLEYNAIVEKNKDLADVIFDNVINKPKILQLFKDGNREDLYNELVLSYKQMGIKYNISQIHFHTGDARSLLRMDKKELYGDQLTKSRESITYVNKNHKSYYGFEKGRLNTGFRYVYPLIDNNYNQFLGSVEISFNPKSFIDNYTQYFNSKKVDFFINEKINDDRNYSNYVKSPIAGYVYDKDILDALAIKNLKNHQIMVTQEESKEIAKKIKLGVPFAIHLEKTHEIIVLIPIVNKLSGEVVASLGVSKDDSYLRYRFDEMHQVVLVVMIVLVFIMFFVYREFLSKKRALIELANNQKILDSQSSFIIITDGYEIKRVNKTFLSFFGYPDVEAFKKVHPCVCDFFEYEEGKNYILKDMNGVNWFEYIKDPTHSDKQVKIYDTKSEEHIFYIEINFSDILEDGNHIVTFIDITHLKNIENQLFYSEKMASLGNMIGNIAHQWRQPLSVISTCASGIAMKHELGVLKDEEIEPNMELIVGNTRYLSETIDIFRDFIKESGEKEQRKVSVGEVIAITLSIMEASLKNHYIKVLFEETQENYYKTMAKGELAQVVTNLINNAKDVLIDREIQDPMIKIEMRKNGKNLLITLEDNAGGIKDDIIKNVFEPYFTTKHKSKGTGLGLYICHKIVTESLGGKIYVRNGEIGAKFHIEIELDQN